MHLAQGLQAFFINFSELSNIGCGRLFYHKPGVQVFCKSIQPQSNLVYLRLSGLVQSCGILPHHGRLDFCRNSDIFLAFSQVVLAVIDAKIHRLQVL